ncbi:MAG: hypothetical protein HOC72_11955, partial [Rhodospirillaceae bacterium]|nr:hypothetical protein [Rhodospirillaceae bacterium]
MRWNCPSPAGSIVTVLTPGRLFLRRMPETRISMLPKARENLENALSVIERHDAAINGMITVTAEQAREAADAADQAAANGQWLGLLHGMPMAIKDNIQTAGVRTTSGSLHFKDVVPNQDAFVVQRLKAAGAVILGKATMQELA